MSSRTERWELHVQPPRPSRGRPASHRRRPGIAQVLGLAVHPDKRVYANRPPIGGRFAYTRRMCVLRTGLLIDSCVPRFRIRSLAMPPGMLNRISWRVSRSHAVPVVNRTLHAAPKAHSHRSLGQRPRYPAEKCTHPEGVPHLPCMAVRHQAARRFRIDTFPGGRGRPPSSGVDHIRVVGKEPCSRARPDLEGGRPRPPGYRGGSR